MFSNNNATNPLNLFPSTTGAPATQTKLEKLLSSTTNRPPTEIQRTLAYKLFDDSFEYMTTLDMNRAASFTFGYQNSYGQNGTTSNELSGGTHGESISNQLWEFLIDSILNRSTHHSVLALTKTLHLIQHVLIHGSEASVMNVDLLYRIEMAVNPLRNLNTALVEQQIVESILSNEKTGLENDGLFHLSSLSIKATATMLKLKGGSVDKGFPVRTAASNLFDVVSTTDNLQRLRMQQATQNNSLVPVGTAKQVGFITDEARYRLLQQQMAREESLQKQKKYQEEQKMRATRSNLAGVSASDGFGGGFASGSQVVGAAHSLEDMIKSARYELEQHKLKQQQKISSMKKGYSDDPFTRAQQVAEIERSSNWQNDPKMMEKEKALRDALDYLEEMQREQQAQNGNLLDGGFDDLSPNNATKTDLLNAGATADLLGFDASSNVSSPSTDLLGFDQPITAPPPSTSLDPFTQQNSATNSSSFANTNLNFMTGSEVRPSLVTGNSAQFTDELNNKQSDLLVMGGNNIFNKNSSKAYESVGGYNDNSTLTSWQREEAEAEKSRKMGLAAGLFAGVVTSKPNPSANATTILSAPSELYSPTMNILAQEPEYTTNIPTLGHDATLEPPIDFSFGAAPMGGISGEGIVQPPSMAPPPPPLMAPPPPPPLPAMAPPPPPPTVPTNAMNNPMQSIPQMQPNFDPSNFDKDQMIQMMMQQQAQMQQMLNMMSSMGMNPSMMQGNHQQQQGQNQFNNQEGSGSNGAGWPPT
jgi:hypothetical protein